MGGLACKNLDSSHSPEEMDMWVVAAAAAASYVAKYWNNISIARDNVSENFKHRTLESPSHPLSKLVERGKKLNEVGSTSTSTDNFNEYNGFYSPLGLYSDVNEVLESEMESNYFHDSLSNRSSLWSRRENGRTIKPLNSIESCLMAQLNMKHMWMDEYTLPSPCAPTMRPLLVTDGKRIISKVGSSSFKLQVGTGDYKLQKEGHLEKNQRVFGFAPLPKLECWDYSKKIKSKAQNDCSGRSNNLRKITKERLKNLQEASHDGRVLFCLGISAGIIVSYIASRDEVEKLNVLLKQTDNLVRDLHDELEMNDSLTVKELADDEKHELPDACHSSKQHLDNHETYGKMAENASEESMSKIEAELEAELERLELNMKISTSDGLSRLPSFVDDLELGPEFEADFAQGELRVNKRLVNADFESTRNHSSKSTPDSGNYSVSPRELSLRLHEVIKSRLEERVKELEIALEDSQRKVQFMESACNTSWTKFRDIDESINISSDTSPISIVKHEVNPMVMSLSGEAQDAYNEAYEELIKIEESEEEEEHPQPEIDHQDDSCLFHRSVPWSRSGSMPHCMDTEEKTLEEFLNSRVRPVEEEDIHIDELLDVYGSEGEEEKSDCDSDDALIKQIVEKTKKGSPVVLNAQRLLFSMETI